MRLLLLFFLLLTSIIAEPITIVPVHPTKAYIKEQKRLLKVERKWAKPFHMTDWTIELTPVPLEILQEICPYACMAASNWHPEFRYGQIYILEQSGYTKAMKAGLKAAHRTVWDDQRDSVVHEMLHNVLGNMNRESAVVILTHLLKP